MTGVSVPTIHFVSGLPRAGSTLLAAILRQNPRFHAGMTSPVGGLFATLLGEMSGRSEFSMFIDDERRKRVLHGLFAAYYADVEAEVVFDTNRLWCSKVGALKALFPRAKLIACVREVSWIMDSIERLVRANAFSPSSMFNFQALGTVYTRTNALAGPEGMVGFAFDALKEAFFGPDADRLLMVRYESLVAHPRETLEAIYAFIGEPVFAHDFDSVRYDASEFDAKAGTPGLHTVRPVVQAVPRRTILPPDLFRRFESDAFWNDGQAGAGASAARVV